MTQNNAGRFMWQKFQQPLMKTRTTTRLPALLSLIALLLVAGCTSLPPAGSDQILVDTHPHSPSGSKGQSTTRAPQ